MPAELRGAREGRQARGKGVGPGGWGWFARALAMRGLCGVLTHGAVPRSCAARRPAPRLQHQDAAGAAHRPQWVNTLAPCSCGVRFFGGRPAGPLRRPAYAKFLWGGEEGGGGGARGRRGGAGAEGVEKAQQGTCSDAGGGGD